MPSISVRRRIVPPTVLVLPVDSSDGAFELTLSLILDLNALCLIQEKTGLVMPAGIEQIFDKPDAKTITVTLWAALQAYHPEYAGNEGLQLVRSLVTLDTLTKAFGA